MRTFGADFAAELAGESPELFITAAFYFTSARGTIYVSDRPVTVDGIAHLPIVPRDPSGWGELSSVFDRLTTSVDVQQTTLTFSNYPLTTAEAALFPGQLQTGLRWSDILHAEAEATEVDVWWTVRRASDGVVFKEKAFRGIAKGAPKWSFETATCTLYSLYEKYLTGNALNTIDPVYNRFCRESDRNSTRPKVLGHVPRSIGRVAKGRICSDPVAAATNNAASGELTEVTVENEQLYVKYKVTSGVFGLQFTLIIHMVTSTTFTVSGRSSGSGTITEDFITSDGVFRISSGAWDGIFFAGDLFYVYVDTGQSYVEFSEVLADRISAATFGGIDTVYANGVGIDTTDIRLAEEGGAIQQIGGPGGDSSGTIVHHDPAFSGGGGNFLHLYGHMVSGSPTDPDGVTVANSIVTPFIVPSILVSGHLIAVALHVQRWTGGTGNIAPIYVSILDSFNPFGNGYGVFGGIGKSYVDSSGDLAYPPQNLTLDYSTDPPSPASGTSTGSGESYITRSVSIPNTNINDFYYLPDTWFTINADLIPGKQYWLAVLIDAQAFDKFDVNQFYYVHASPVDEFNQTYIVPPPPGESIVVPTNTLFGEAYTYDNNAGAWVPTRGAYGGEGLGVSVGMLYSGGVFTQNPADSPMYRQQLQTNHGIIAKELGLIVGRDPGGTLEGTVTVNLHAAETTGQSRELVGSISLTADDMSGVAPGFSKGITKPLPKPVILRPGFYNVDVVGEIDSVTKKITGWTFHGASFADQVAQSGGGSGFFTTGYRVPITGLQSTSLGLAIIIKAAKLTREIATVSDSLGTHQVARVGINTWLPDEWEFTADVRGLGYSFSTRCDSLIHLMLNDAGTPDEWIDLADTFTDSAAEYISHGYSFEGTVVEQQTFKDLIFRLAFECRSIFDWSVDLARLKFIPDGPGAADATIAYADTVARGVVPEVTVEHTDSDKILNAIEVLYKRRYDRRSPDQEFLSKVSRTDSRSIGIYGRKEQKDGANPFRMLYVRQTRMALDLLSFWLARYANPRTAITLQTDWLALGVEKDDQMNLSNL